MDLYFDTENGSALFLFVRNCDSQLNEDWSIWAPQGVYSGVKEK